MSFDIKGSLITFPTKNFKPLCHIEKSIKLESHISLFRRTNLGKSR